MKLNFYKNCRKIMSDRAKLYISKNGNPFQGRKHSKASKEKIGKSAKGRNLGSNSPTYKGRYVNSDGYIWLRINGKQIKEHRYVMEKHLGRSLRKTEDVHHINGDKQDNRIKNLKAINYREHRRIHAWGNSHALKIKKLLVE